VISEALAKRVWPHGDPIGRRIRFGVDIPNNGEPWLTVVGVVADVKARLNSDSPRSLLFMTWLEWVNQMNVVVRTSGDPLLLAGAIRSEINRLDPSLAVGRIETVNQVLEKSLSAERFRTWLLICFAIAALLLAFLCPPFAVHAGTSNSLMDVLPDGTLIKELFEYDQAAQTLARYEGDFTQQRTRLSQVVLSRGFPTAFAQDFGLVQAHWTVQSPYESLDFESYGSPLRMR